MYEPERKGTVSRSEMPNNGLIEEVACRATWPGHVRLNGFKRPTVQHKITEQDPPLIFINYEAEEK